MIQEIRIDNHTLHTEFYPHPTPTEETLIFLHDAWGCCSTWSDFPHILAHNLGMNILLYDRAGHGLSSEVDYERRPITFFSDEGDRLVLLMDALHIDQATLFGFSDGGTISLVAAARHPERIKSLILQSAHTCVEPSGTAHVANITEQAQHTRLISKLTEHHGSNTQRMFDHWSKMWSDPLFARWNIISEIQQITCPIIAYRGADDLFDTIVQLSTITQHTNARIATCIIPHAAHNPAKEAPTQTLAFILNEWKNKQSPTITPQA